MLGEAQLDEVFSLGMALNIRFVKPLDALLSLKQLLDSNFKSRLACRNSEKLDEVFVSGEPLVHNSDFVSDIFSKIEPELLQRGCLRANGLPFMFMCRWLIITA